MLGLLNLPTLPSRPPLMGALLPRVTLFPGDAPPPNSTIWQGCPGCPSDLTDESELNTSSGWGTSSADAPVLVDPEVPYTDCGFYVLERHVLWTYLSIQAITLTRLQNGIGSDLTQKDYLE